MLQSFHSLSTHHPSTHVIDSSFVYQSKPMYVTNQPELLSKAFNDPRKYAANGSCPIVINITLYNSDIARQENLTIPYIGIVERKFVLDPLTEL
ncbi:hypothetical protein PtA15_15A225 [Puccinia triticina]|uniref:Uncharacterized protein n=1 Tax=Puccinia triticina TaxID=208348 RepID=A0ABY7D3Z0_9BASI|nr:uncharacterized protein PtA15_15A225 [Puccinia triticina]WAQ91833.1 hypothetical protein PtA15_15A225 [Puccinia triticina]WAR62628.1 hypothetical protein PtB15_15B215 [Puccinia triticina]